MGHEDRGDAEVTLQAHELELQVGTQGPVERREWLVEQENRWMGGERSRHGNALLLTAGHLARQAIGEGREADEIDRSCATR